MTDANASYKVVLVFQLKPGTADVELERSMADDSFPALLAREEGFQGLELIKLSADRTMSVQTWRSAQDWWAALEKVKHVRANATRPAEEEILVSRDFFGGAVIASRLPPSRA